MHTRTDRRRIQVEFGDCDPNQIAYYPNIVAWVDRSTHHMFDAAGLPLRELQMTRGMQVPIVNLVVKFIGPACWGDAVEIESCIHRWGSKSFDIHHRITNVVTGETVVEATETRVCVTIDPQQPKSIAAEFIPDDLRAAFNAEIGLAQQ